MNVITNGNIVQITLTEEDNRITAQLPDGYSLESINIITVDNIAQISSGCDTFRGQKIIFPTVNSKNPCSLKLSKIDPTKPAYASFSISKFGQIPDPNYFIKAFEPILVTAEDGKEYKVIPSDQFK